MLILRFHVDKNIVNLFLFDKLHLNVSRNFKSKFGYNHFYMLHFVSSFCISKFFRTTLIFKQACLNDYFCSCATLIHLFGKFKFWFNTYKNNLYQYLDQINQTLKRLPLELNEHYFISKQYLLAWLFTPFLWQGTSIYFHWMLCTIIYY